MSSNKKKLTPSQKRAIKEAQKRANSEEKRARLIQNLGLNKKQPRIQKDPDSIMQLNMKWDCTKADVEGYWSWGQPRQWSSEEWTQQIECNLKELEKLTWAEIYAQRTNSQKYPQKHHFMPLDQICSEAQKRWRLLELEEYAEMLFRFRVTGKLRLWGYQNLDKFFLIWWDPEHKIYPVDKADN